MTPSNSPADEPSPQHVRLRQFSRWMHPIIFGFAVLEGVAFATFGDWPSGITSIILLCFGCSLLFAKMYLHRGNARRAATTIWVGLLGADSLIVLVQPALFPTLIAIPLLVVAVALPFLTGRDLRRLILVCWLVALFVAIVGALLPRYSTLPSWFAILFGVSSLAAALAMILLLLWQFSSRLNETLAQTQAANTELCAVQMAMEAQNAYLEVTLHSIDDGVITTGASGNIRSLNRAAELLTGWQEAEALGKPFTSICHLIHEETGALLTSPVEALLHYSTNTPSDSQAQLIARDGARRSVIRSAAILHGREREVIGIVLVIHDVTAYKRTNDERLMLERNLLETQKLESLGVLAGGIAHDFNNLLATVLGNAELALLDVSTTEPAYASIVQIERGARQAANLTQQLLAYAGRGHFVTETINVNVVVDEMLSLLRTSINKRVHLATSLTPHLPYVMADITQIRQVVMNLVINGSEAIGEVDGDIVVRTWIEQAEAHAREAANTTYVALSVTDSGIGMDALTKAKIFEPFYTTKFTGRGLGLAAVQGIVRSHHGVIQVASTPGEGTTITVLLPLSTEVPACDEQTTTRQTVSAQHALVPNSEGALVLVVDDEPSVRAMTAQMLERFGYQTLFAADGLEAVELFTEHAAAISCVILDMTMPRMDGIMTLQACQKIAPHVPVVLMSGYTAEEVNSRFAGESFVGFLHKPFTLSELRQMLDSVLVHEGGGFCISPQKGALHDSGLV